MSDHATILFVGALLMSELKNMQHSRFSWVWLVLAGVFLFSGSWV